MSLQEIFPDVIPEEKRPLEPPTIIEDDYEEEEYDCTWLHCNLTN